MPFGRRLTLLAPAIRKRACRQSPDMVFVASGRRSRSWQADRAGLRRGFRRAVATQRHLGDADDCSSCPAVSYTIGSTTAVRVRDCRSYADLYVVPCVVGIESRL